MGEHVHVRKQCVTNATPSLSSESHPLPRIPIRQNTLSSFILSFLCPDKSLPLQSPACECPSLSLFISLSSPCSSLYSLHFMSARLSATSFLHPDLSLMQSPFLMPPSLCGPRGGPSLGCCVSLSPLVAPPWSLPHVPRSVAFFQRLDIPLPLQSSAVSALTLVTFFPCPDPCNDTTVPHCFKRDVSPTLIVKSIIYFSRIYSGCHEETYR